MLLTPLMRSLDQEIKERMSRGAGCGWVTRVTIMFPRLLELICPSDELVRVGAWHGSHQEFRVDGRTARTNLCVWKVHAILCCLPPLPDLDYWKKFRPVGGTSTLRTGVEHSRGILCGLFVAWLTFRWEVLQRCLEAIRIVSCRRDVRNRGFFHRSSVR